MYEASDFIKFRNYASLSLLLLYKLLLIILINTYYVADEYWQTLEVAHRQAFGYGYLTWEWRYKIRSYIYPSIISLIYRLVAYFRLDYPAIVIYLPRICQALFSGFAEYRFLKWSDNGKALLFLATNPFWSYCITRTLDNTLEASVMLIILSIFPWNNEERYSSKFLWLVGFMIFIRPLSVINWILLCVYHIYTSNKSTMQLIKDYVTIGLITAGISVAIDSYYYGELVVTPWELFKHSFFTKSIEAFSLMESVRWYFFDMIPSYLLIKAFLLPIGYYIIWTNSEIISVKQAISIVLLAWIVTVYSMLPYKEYRYILSTLPLIVYVILNFKFLSDIFHDDVTLSLAGIIFLMNFSTMIAICFERSGSVMIMNDIRREIARGPSDVDVMFLTPCYSTPFYSHVHQNISMNFLTCEPNFEGKDNYVHESDAFFKNPLDALVKRYANATLPKLIVMYDNLVPRIRNFLYTDYKLVAEKRDSWSDVSGDRSQFICLYRLK